MKTGNRLFLKLLAVLALSMVSAGGLSAQLSVTGAAVEPSTVEPGESISVTLNLTNVDPTTPVLAGETISAEVTFTNIETGKSFDGTLTGSTLEAIDEEGGSGEVVLSGMAVPVSTTDAGSYRITVSMTAPNKSTFSSPDGVLTVEGKPDLRVTSLTYPAGISYVGGNTIPMSLTYTNQIASNGDNNVPYVPGYINDNYFRIRLVLSSNPTFGDDDDFDLTWHDIGTRVDADGVDRTVTWTQLLPGNFAGSYYVLAKIDVNEQVDESIEDDLAQNGNNVWYGGAPNSSNNGSVAATRIALDPTNFPSIYWGSDGSDNWSDLPVASEDGRYTVFASDATNLVEDDVNGQRDVFVFDLQTSTIRRLSKSQQIANAPSTRPYISADATKVVFDSEATNLIQGDTNRFSDIFMTATFEDDGFTRVSVASGGGQSNGSSFRPSLSADGRLVVFESNATNLVSPATTVGITHIYLRDTQNGTTSLVSRDPAGVSGNGTSSQARLSADGRYVVFASDASNLVASDTNGLRDIFLHDTQTGTTTRVSVGTGGTESNGFSRSPSISADGGMIAFHSAGSNLVSGDTNGVNDVFVHTVATATTTRVSITSAGGEASDPSLANFQLGSINPSISASGRYVAFASLADNLTDGDSGGQYSATDANRALDIFVHDRDVSDSGTFDLPGNIETSMISRNRFGMQTIRVLGQPSTAAADIFPAISADGRWVAFPSDAESRSGLAHEATNRLSRDDNGYRDVFIHDRRTNALPNPGNTPEVSLSAPGDGSTVGLNATVTVSAVPSTPVGTIASVEFFVGSLSLGVVTSLPYSVEWTPTVEGVYSLSALVIDNFENQAVSDPIIVAVSATSVPVDDTAFHTGSYIDGFESGSVTILSDGSKLTFISAAFDGSNAKTYSGVPVDSSGNFSLVQDGQTVLSGQLTGGTAIGQFGSAQFVTSQVPASPSYTGPAGSIYGSILNNADSETVFVVAPDGQMRVMLTDGEQFEIAEGSSSSLGTLTATTPSGGRLTGSYDAETGFLNAQISGGLISGNVTGALSSDTAPSNGVMRNLSTRGSVGVGDKVLVAGFVVSGNASKQVLIRALGPTIGAAPFNVPDAIADPALIVRNAFDVEVASNDNWWTDSNVASSSATAGAFALPSGSLDAAVVATLAPGAYTAAVSGADGSSGVGLVEIYDVITPAAFSQNKLLNVSTRGEVSGGDKALIAGVIINGTTPKRVLIRAVGPTLNDFEVTDALADPVLRLVRQDDGAVIRENNDWQVGNDTAQISAVAVEVGAFALPSGSKDAALLITLPPGIYTALVTSADGSEGIALVEVYEVP